MLTQLRLFPFHALYRIQMYSLSICRFSWKSRLHRDPDLRERKKEALEKRYTLRRIGVLEGSAEEVRSHAVHLEQVCVSIGKILSDFRAQLRIFTNCEYIDKIDVENIRIGGSSRLSHIASLSQPNSRTVVVVAKDPGSVDLIYKFVKRANAHWDVNLIDRERVIVTINDKLFSADKEVSQLRKQTLKNLKKSELLKYNEIKTEYGPNQCNTLGESIRSKYAIAEEEILK